MKNYRIYFKRLLSIAIPLILSRIINQLQMLIDRIFLGHADTLYMSVLGNATFPLWTTMDVCFSIATGASILISQSVGAKNIRNTEEYAGSLIKYQHIVPFALFFLWFFGSELIFRILGVSKTLLPMCVDYARFSAPIFLLIGLGNSISVVFQTSNHTKHLAVWSALRSILNIFFDWVLIFGKFGFPAMGVKGAALGTTIAEYLGGVYLVVAFCKSGKLFTRPSWQGILKARIKSYLHAARLGINTALESFCWNLGNLVIIRILNSINELAAGIYSIIFGVEILAVVIIEALGSATLTLSSEAFGKNDEKQYKGFCASAYTICCGIAFMMILAVIVAPQQIISVFTKDESIISSSGIYLLFIAINLFSKAGNMIIGSGIRGSGDTRWMFLTQIFGTIFIVSCASLFVFKFNLGIAGVFLAVMADESTRFVINLVKYRKICKGMSVHKV